MTRGLSVESSFWLAAALGAVACGPGGSAAAIVVEPGQGPTSAVLIGGTSGDDLWVLDAPLFGDQTAWHWDGEAWTTPPGVLDALVPTAFGEAVALTHDLKVVTLGSDGSVTENPTPVPLRGAVTLSGRQGTVFASMTAWEDSPAWLGRLSAGAWTTIPLPPSAPFGPTHISAATADELWASVPIGPWDPASRVARWDGVDWAEHNFPLEALPPLLADGGLRYATVSAPEGFVVGGATTPFAPGMVTWFDGVEWLVRLIEGEGSGWSGPFAVGATGPVAVSERMRLRRWFDVPWHDIVLQIWDGEQLGAPRTFASIQDDGPAPFSPVEGGCADTASCRQPILTSVGSLDSGEIAVFGRLAAGRAVLYVGVP